MIFAIHAKSFIEKHLQKLDDHPCAEENADTFDQRRTIARHDLDEPECTDDQRCGPDINGGVETALAKGKQARDAIPIAMERRLAKMPCALIGHDVRCRSASQRQ